MQDRDGVAYSLFIVKSIDSERRMISGIATTPTPDDSGDVIEPLGLKFRNPLPLLMHHDRKLPVGNAVFGRPTPAGVPFDATFPVVEEPGTVKTRVDEAWHSVKAGLIRGVSVGIKILTKDVERIKDGGLRILRSEVFELSLVTIPANAEATITSIKQFDLAASGLHSPGDSGSLPVVKALKDAPVMNTIAEQIASFEATRAAKVASMVKMMTESEGQTLDPTQTETYTTLKSEVDAIDAHLPRLRDLEKMNVASAVPVTNATNIEKALEVRGGNPVITVKASVPKGTAFTRYMQAKIVGKNSISDAIRFAESQKHWVDQTPEVIEALKAAVNPGTIAEPAWAAPLAVQRPMQEEFLDLLRPATILGKVPGFKRVPFNVSVPVQTGGGTYQWVGEGGIKPVGNLQFSSVTLGIAKAAGIIVISEELAKISSPSAEATVRNDMIKGMAYYLDQQFIDPTVAAVTNVSPASITNLANGYATAGTSADNARTDLKKAITLFTASLLPVSEAVWIMSEANAFALSTYLTTNSIQLYPGLTATGGTLFGIPVVTSQTAGNVVALVHAPSILFADDGGVNIDVSREASLEMNTAPTSPATASTTYVNLWQSNLIGLRAERFINWKRARTTAVVYTTATYL